MSRVEYRNVVRTTIHPFEPKRAKSHMFLATFKSNADLNESTGKTRCGRTTYATLRMSRPTDTKCKLCFRGNNAS